MATLQPTPPVPPPAGAKDAEKPTSQTDVTTRRAEKTAEAQIDPGAAARAAALAPEPVYYLPDQAFTNPGVQGYVFRPHQEKNPGADLPGRAKERDALAAQVRLEHEARGRRWQAVRDAAAARGEPLPEPVGPVRLRMSVAVDAHSVIDEDKLTAVAAAADALVAALRDAGVDPHADVSGIPI
jgi:hypothetical protein